MPDSILGEEEDFANYAETYMPKTVKCEDPDKGLVRLTKKDGGPNRNRTCDGALGKPSYILLNYGT